MIELYFTFKVIGAIISLAFVLIYVGAIIYGIWKDYNQRK